MKRVLLILAVAGLTAHILGAQDIVKQGEEVFNKSCATGYCHGARGTAGGAPRLAAPDPDPGPSRLQREHTCHGRDALYPAKESAKLCGATCD